MTATPFLRLALAASILSTLSLGAGCGGGGGGGGGGDTTPPTVTAKSTDAAPTAVPVYADITATFSEAMDEATLDGALHVYYSGGPRSGEELTGTWSTTGTTVTFEPTNPLAPGQQYQASVDWDVEDLAGNRLGGSGYGWTFTAAPPLRLQVTVSDETGGCGIGFSSASEGTSCGPDCMQYGEGAVVTIVPNCGTQGDGIATWGGACGGASVDGSCTVTMDSDLTATADFQRLRRRLLVTTSGSGTGTVTAVPTGTYCGGGCLSFAYGAAVTLTSNPEPDSGFVAFAGACTLGTCVDLVMSQDRTVTAQFDLKSYQVNVSATTHGSYGQTAGTGSCGAGCTTYDHGTEVTITATPDSGYDVSWAGPCTGSSLTCTFTATASVDADLTFVPRPYDLTLLAGASGAIQASPAGSSCGPGCVTYDYGTEVTLTAVPDTGYHWTDWTDSCAGNGGTSCTFTVIGDATAGANFAINSYDLAVTKAGNGAAKGDVVFFPGGIPCGATSECMTYDHGTDVTLSVDLATGATFTGWSGGGCSGTGDCVVSVSSATAVTATFTLDRHDLTVTKAGAGTGAVASSPAGISCGVDCDGTYDYETSVTLTATPDTGSTFQGWSGGGCTGTGTCVVSVTGPASVQATFEKARFDVQVTMSGTGSGTGTIGFVPAGTSCGPDCQTYDYGTPVTVTQSADPGSAFTGWTGDCVGTGACSFTVDAAKSVTATFQLERTVSVSVSHLNADGLVLWNNGLETVNLNAGATGGTFATRIPDGGTYGVTIGAGPSGGTQSCSLVGTTAGAVSGDVTVQVDCSNLVVATYPAAPMWSDYVKAASSAVACDGTETGGYAVCIHGGERRSVQTFDQTSCANLVAADALGAFDWECVSTDPVTFESTGLKAGKRLSDLIKWTSPYGFLPNSVTVTDTSTGSAVFTSATSAWWTNTFPWPDNLNFTPGDGEIKLITVSPGNFTLSYATHGWALVVKSGAQISTPTSGASPALTVSGNFTWVEGTFFSQNAVSGGTVRVIGAKFPVIRGASIRKDNGISEDSFLYVGGGAANGRFSQIDTSSSQAMASYGVRISGGTANSFHDLSLPKVSTAAIWVESSTLNRVWNVKTWGVLGMFLSNANGNAFQNFVIANTATNGVQSSASSDNVLTDFVIAGAARGIWLLGASSTSNAIGHVTVANTTSDAIALGFPTLAITSDRLTLFDVVSANAGGAALTATSNAGPSLMRSTVHNLVATHSVTGVGLVNAENNVFSGALKVGGNVTDCSVSGGTAPGLDGSCASGAALTSGVGLLGSLVGSVTTDDSVNPDDTSGTGSPTSWAFENPFRTWGAGGALFPDASVRGRCTALPCQIYDWGLYDLDAVLRNVDAPAATAGTVLTHTWSNATTTSFLSGAIEVMGDGIGDDDGLCESNETCLYAPNVGAYQGHGTLGEVAVIDNGAVVNVTLLGYGTNGYPIP